MNTCKKGDKFMGLFGLFSKNKKEQKVIYDEILGKLTLCEEGWVGDITMKLFEKEHDIDLVLEYEEEPDTQIYYDSYRKYKYERENIEREVERIIASQYDYADESDILSSTPLRIELKKDGSVSLICAIDEEAIVMAEFELLPQVRYIADL